MQINQHAAKRLLKYSGKLYSSGYLSAARRADGDPFQFILSKGSGANKKFAAFMTLDRQVAEYIIAAKPGSRQKVRFSTKSHKLDNNERWVTTNWALFVEPAKTKSEEESERVAKAAEEKSISLNFEREADKEKQE